MNKNFTTPVSRVLLEKELNATTLARTWRDLEIHFVKKKLAPNVLFEVNRISTLMFNLDYLDSDIFDETYTYIVVYDRVNGQIVSFYRYIICKNAIHSKHDVHLSTAHYFNFSDEFVEKILPFTIEFGRSVVNKTAIRHVDGLSAVWMGLGILIYEYHLHPKNITIDFFFGKFSLQWNIYSEVCRDMILFLFNKHFPPMCGSDSELYIVPRHEYETTLDFVQPALQINSSRYKDDRKILMQYLDSFGLPMPKLAEAYANLGGLKSFGTISNDHLKSWETVILQKIDQVDPFYIKRFVDGYETINPVLFE